MGRRPDASETATARHEPLSPGRIALVLVIHYLLLTSLDTVVIGFPVHGDRIGLGDRAIGLLAAWFTGVALVYRFLVWHLAARRGTGVALAVAAAASTIGPPLYLATTHPAGLAAVRAFHGLAPGSFLTGTLVILLEMAPPRAHPTLLGLHGALNSLSFATAPVIALWLLGPGRGAPWLFGTSAAVGLAAALLMAAGGLLASRRPPTPSADAPSDRVTVNVLRIPGVGVSCGLAIVAGMGLGSTVAFGAVHALRHGLGRPEVLFLAFALAGALARVVGARFAASVGYRPVVTTAFLVEAAGFVTLALAASPLHLAAAGAMIGAGFGCAHTSLLSHLMNHVTERQRWGGATWFTTAFEMGVTAGPAVVGLLAARFSLAAGLAALSVAALAAAAAAPVVLNAAPPGSRESAGPPGVPAGSGALPEDGAQQQHGAAGDVPAPSMETDNP